MCFCMLCNSHPSIHPSTFPVFTEYSSNANSICSLKCNRLGIATWRSSNDICTFYLEWFTPHRQVFSLRHNADVILVNVILRCLDLWNIFRVSGEPEDLITGEGQGHENKQGLKEIREWGTEKEVTGVSLKLILSGFVLRSQVRHGGRGKVFSFPRRQITRSGKLGKGRQIRLPGSDDRGRDKTGKRTNIERCKNLHTQIHYKQTNKKKTAAKVQDF